jgi:hypothetical protein
VVNIGLDWELKLRLTGWTGESISSTVGAAIPPEEGTGTTFTFRLILKNKKSKLNRELNETKIKKTLLAENGCANGYSLSISSATC